MDVFDKAEQQNRPAALIALESLISGKDWTIIEPTPDKKTHYDFILEKNGKKVLVECKARCYDITAFADWQLDGAKIEYLVKEKLKDPSVIGLYYLNTFKNGAYAVWNLCKKQGEWRKSKPHYRKAVLKDEIVETYDLFLKLDTANVVYYGNVR